MDIIRKVRTGFMNKIFFCVTKDLNKKKQSRLNITLLGIKFRFTQENIFKYINTNEKFCLYFAGLKICKHKYKNLYKKIQHTPKELNLLKTVIDVNSVKSMPGRITDFHKAYGYYLKIITSILEEHNLLYWIDFGTLLGAVRHKGFIPWDDDTDITMLREDYYKAISIWKEKLAPYGFIVWEGGIKNCHLTRILYKCFQVDIFPADLYYKKVETKEEIKQIDKKMETARNLFFNKFCEVIPCPLAPPPTSAIIPVKP